MLADEILCVDIDILVNKLTQNVLTEIFFRASYDIQVEPDYFTDALHQVNQRIQLVIPGPPDPPEIFLKSVSPEEFVIEWGEPRLFGGVKVRGYQVSNKRD